MKDRPATDINKILEEIYVIDPTLREHQADLPNLITTLEANRPQITIDATFVHNLRTSLLTATPAHTMKLGSTPSPFIWWATRLAPVGLALLVIVMILPKQATPPSQEYYPKESIPFTLEMAPGSQGDAPNTMADDTSMMMMESSATALMVYPPVVGETATVTLVLLPEAGWVVIHAQNDGQLGAVLGATFLEAGEYSDVEITLSRQLQYPEMIDVVVYTGNSREQFVSSNENIQLDPFSNVPMTVTVPVVSDLELQMQE